MVVLLKVARDIRRKEKGRERAKARKVARNLQRKIQRRVVVKVENILCHHLPFILQLGHRAALQLMVRSLQSKDNSSLYLETSHSYLLYLIFNSEPQQEQLDHQYLFHPVQQHHVSRREARIRLNTPAKTKKQDL